MTEFGDDVYQQAEDDTGNDGPLDEEELAQDTGYSPPDHEPRTLRLGEHETLDERLEEEEPDIDPTSSVDEAADPRAGRLVAPDEGAHADEERDLIASDAGIAGGAASAEEAAVHIVGEDDINPGS